MLSHNAPDVAPFRADDDDDHDHGTLGVALLESRPWVGT